MDLMDTTWTTFGRKARLILWTVMPSTSSMATMNFLAMRVNYCRNSDGCGGCCIPSVDVVEGAIDFGCKVWRMPYHDWLDLCFSSY